MAENYIIIELHGCNNSVSMSCRDATISVCTTRDKSMTNLYSEIMARLIKIIFLI
jgi:hypothetical protein